MDLCGNSVIELRNLLSFFTNICLSAHRLGDASWLLLCRLFRQYVVKQPYKAMNMLMRLKELSASTQSGCMVMT